MKFVKLFKWYELVYYGVICSILITLGIVFHSSWVIITNALLGITTSFLLSKAIILGNAVGLVQVAFYIYLSFQNRYYGEIISCSLTSIPIYIISLITWLKNKDHGRVKINNKFGYKELILTIAVVFCLSFGFYYMLRAFNTANLIISTVSVCLGCFKGYLQIRRSELNFIFSLINRVITFVLWLCIVLGGSLGYIPTVVTYAMYFTLDVFGLTVWLRLKKKQKTEKLTEIEQNITENEQKIAEEKQDL